jgi:hypothetical protein
VDSIRQKNVQKVLIDQLNKNRYTNAFVSKKLSCCKDDHDDFYCRGWEEAQKKYSTLLSECCFDYWTACPLNECTKRCRRYQPYEVYVLSHLDSR